ncbi:MAG: TlpA family protein disulfide reductase [Acidobacteriaceae bacterium]
MKHPILRRSISSLALGILLLSVAAFTPARAQDGPHKLVGHLAPAFALKNFQQKTIHLSQFRGKVILLNFWASWCAPCQAEMPTFAQWQSQYHGKLQVIGVNMDDEMPKAEAVARKLKVNYPLVVGTAHMGEAYGGIYGLPVTFLIDAHGRIRAEYQGGNHVSQIHSEIQNLLAHPAH